MSIIQTITKIDRLATDEKWVVRLNPIDYAKMKKYILDNEFKADLEEKLVKDLEEKDDKNDEIVLEDIWIFMSKIVEDVEEWAKEPMRGYLELKKIANWCKNFLDILWDEAYNDFENWDKNELPYGFIWQIQNRLTVKYDDNPRYAELKTESEALEAILKEAVTQNEKWRTINDEEGNVIEVPSYSYKASLVVKQWKVNK